MAEVGRLALLSGFLGAPVAWVVHLMASYFLVALGCAGRWAALGPGLLGVTALCLAAALGAGLLAYRNWRRIRTPLPGGAVLDAERIRGFMLLGGVLMAGLFGLLILLAGAGALFVPPC